MNKIIRVIAYVVIALVFVSATIFTLMANKAQNEKEAELANIQAKALPVKVDTVAFVSNAAKIEASGTIKNETDLMLMAKAQGQIVKVVREKGDWVKKGDPIVVLERDVLLAQQELAKANHESAKRDYERMKRLAEHEAVTKKQLEDMAVKLSKTSADYKAISKNLENTIVKSPVSGFITDSYVKKGAIVSGGIRICNIISPKNLLINVLLSGEEVALISNGDAVSVLVKAFPNDTFNGTVSNIALKAATNNKFSVEIQLEANEKLKAGMYANATISKGLSGIIKAPRLAIAGTLKEASVFVVRNNKVYEKSVKIGESYGDSVSIASGLQTNEIIVTSGVINLYNKADVRIIN